MAKEIVAGFRELWSSLYALAYDEFYENYRERYKIIKHQRECAKEQEITSIESYTLKPNNIQVKFITNLRKIVESGETKSIIENPKQEYTEYLLNACRLERRELM